MHWLRKKWVRWLACLAVVSALLGWWWLASLSDTVQVMRILRELDSSNPVELQDLAKQELQILDEKSIAQIAQALVVVPGYFGEKLAQFEQRFYKLKDTHDERAKAAIVTLGERAASQAGPIARIVQESQGKNKACRQALLAIGPAAAGEYAELLVMADDEELRWNLLYDLTDIRPFSSSAPQLAKFKALREGVAKKLVERGNLGRVRVMSPELRSQWSVAVQWVYLLSDDDGATATALINLVAHDRTVDMVIVRAMSFLGKTKQPLPVTVFPEVLRIVERSDDAQKYTVLFNYMERQLTVLEMQQFGERFGFHKPEDLERIFSDQAVRQEVMELFEKGKNFKKR